MRKPGIPLTPKLPVDTRADRPQASYRLQGLDGHEHLRFLLDKDNLRIGRSSSMNDYAITHDSISRRHVNVRRKSGEWLVEDEGSTNGTAINGQPLLPHQAHRLLTNDILKLGEVSFAFSKA
jgi:pSer/pThr/pTyr-binding forkhead associated (FHA) protein